MSYGVQKLARGIRSLRYGWTPFYRRCGLHQLDHPVQATASVPMIDARIIVSHANRMLFVRVPKCANTTILNTLWLCETKQKLEEMGRLGEHIRKQLQRKKNMKGVFVPPSRLSKEETNRVFAEYTKAIVVRHPFTRLASAYLYEIHGKEKARRYGLSPTLSFAGFCDYLRDGGLHADIHWMPQTDICPIKPSQLDFIGFMENLSEDMTRLTMKVYGQPAPIASRRNHATNAKEHVAQLYSQRERRMVVEELYAGDFTGFGFDPGF